MPSHPAPPYAMHCKNASVLRWPSRNNERTLLSNTHENCTSDRLSVLASVPLSSEVPGVLLQTTCRSQRRVTQTFVKREHIDGRESAHNSPLSDTFPTTPW